MELADFTGKPCRTKMAYEFLPNSKIEIDLEKASTELNAIANIDVKTKVLLMMKLDNLTISLFPSGKLLVRGEREEKKAKEAAEKIVKQLIESIK